MAAPAIEVEGARELRRSLRRMDGRLDDLRETHRAAAERVEAEGERLAPRRSGRLAGSGRVRASRIRAGVTFGGRRVPYAAVIHFGWPRHNIAPQPFAYEALDRRAGEVVELYERRVAELVNRLDLETR